MDMSGLPGMSGDSEIDQASFAVAGAEHHEMMVANIKVEEDMEMNFPGYHAGNDAPSENQHPPNSMDDVKPPGWQPSTKGRSIVWDHITWLEVTQRASCNYCTAEFQIKGGTSALLRHLKTIHPAAINFDPENPPPVVRRKKRKADDYPMVSADTQSYVDNLLQQFMPEENRADGTEPSTSPPLALQDPNNQNSEVLLPPPSQLLSSQPSETAAPTTTQNRAETEIDEVIRNLQKESSAHQPQQDLRTLLGMTDESEIVSVSRGAVATTESPIRMANDEEKQVSSSSSSGGKKRKMEEASRQMAAYHHHQHPGMNSGKLPLSMLHPLRRPPPIHPGLPSSGMSNPMLMNHRMPPMLMPPSSIPPPPFPTTRSPIKNSPEAMEALDMEAKVLHNLSLRAVIDRENAMTVYYRTKARKMELEIKKLARELGEDQVDQEPTEHDPEHEQEE
ncbi:CBN-BED-1 protein [Caenorhabditis brenneri]|uniref:CBN-BED-1 protein n=1 Tax=Caenorhabditis brenneri TaxID=135651 RepID=G0N3A5_CAEBE|nr:CBN-BED-1 protein [Caenorhabditis brenneri]